jgi:hypothetical protein
VPPKRVDLTVDRTPSESIVAHGGMKCCDCPGARRDRSLLTRLWLRQERPTSGPSFSRRVPGAEPALSGDDRGAGVDQRRESAVRRVEELDLNWRVRSLSKQATSCPDRTSARLRQVPQIEIRDHSWDLKS